MPSDPTQIGGDKVPWRALESVQIRSFGRPPGGETTFALDLYEVGPLGADYFDSCRPKRTGSGNVATVPGGPRPSSVGRQHLVTLRMDEAVEGARVPNHRMGQNSTWTRTTNGLQFDVRADRTCSVSESFYLGSLDV